MLRRTPVADQVAAPTSSSRSRRRRRRAALRQREPVKPRSGRVGTGDIAEGVWNTTTSNDPSSSGSARASPLTTEIREVRASSRALVMKIGDGRRQQPSRHQVGPKCPRHRPGPQPTSATRAPAGNPISAKYASRMSRCTDRPSELEDVDEPFDNGRFSLGDRHVDVRQLTDLHSTIKAPLTAAFFGAGYIGAAISLVVGGAHAS